MEKIRISEPRQYKLYLHGATTPEQDPDYFHAVAIL
jgi:hypothetical protein